MNRRPDRPIRASRPNGQALVEFAVGIGVFLMLLIGTVDLGRAAYQYNGVSAAAREIARVASVHPGSGTLGDSPESAAVTATQTGLIPGLAVTSYQCIDIGGTPVAGACHPGDWVRVTVSAAFRPVLPLLVPFGDMRMDSSSSAEIQ